MAEMASPKPRTSVSDLNQTGEKPTNVKKNKEMVRLLGAFHEFTDGTAETFRVVSRPTGARNETQTSGLFAAGSPNDHCQLLLLHGPRSHVMLEDVLKHAGLEMSAGHSTRPPTLPSLTLTLEYFRRLQVKPPDSSYDRSVITQGRRRGVRRARRPTSRACAPTAAGCECRAMRRLR
ncbi:hypothetical protein CH63R_04221 [Colletotrichum higginsianum IMI 349063]|uniref:Uncharacterized protein n=1 Tax=Colletotrichum higginsianum (strain IMI 349063) TaxID=759273 RepID=A0A1B7YIV5_COLHI|nr:hypothetical protein CH63R_04221 [Colletotrichum higginsianum IMI 349063]OBR11925.1 hypothetical protein CH63R_04221 [Colletotrichum higginsianum IMI 349063]